MDQSMQFTLTTAPVQSLLVQLLMEHTSTGNKEETGKKRQEYVSTVQQPDSTSNSNFMKRIEPTVHDVILPPRKGYNYLLWTTNDVLLFLKEFLEKPMVDKIADYEICGSDLWHFFLDEVTSEEWRRHARISHGILLKIRMTLGNIHNILYRL
ncbi:hypothetical protein CAEBREN_07171 [Caenorhabditis brenneri]|uniref:Uncharacterized protein n=1 Tax=Caenorhabditis brenneri TaxID=135651 RepID=G0P607_CAEBE|nr:hypothetical protein CAEBREN_07171 [Caenorhabditis brenneri]